MARLRSVQSCHTHIVARFSACSCRLRGKPKTSGIQVNTWDKKSLILVRLRVGTPFGPVVRQK